MDLISWHMVQVSTTLKDMYLIIFKNFIEKTRQIAHVESALGKKNGKQAKLESAELYDVEGVLVS